jgi:hypothetical protein
MTLSEGCTINYIIAFYIGASERIYGKTFQYDPLYFIKIHKNFLDTCIDTHIKMGTFVINDDIDDNMKEQIVDYVKTCKIPTTVIFRKNIGISYGSWNEAIMNSIDDYDYFFMIEDDYVPDANNFYIPFVERVSDSTPYICGLILHNPKTHAAHSNGIISQKACKRVMETNKSLFKVHGNNKTICIQDYVQVFFLDNFTELGYCLDDVADEYSIKHMSGYVIDEYGISGARCLIPPIIIGA